MTGTRRTEMVPESLETLDATEREARPGRGGASDWRARGHGGGRGGVTRRALCEVPTLVFAD